VVAQPLRRAETLVFFLVLVWPLCGSGGEGGSRVPHAFGWEVPVSIRRSASRTRHGARDFDRGADTPMYLSLAGKLGSVGLFTEYGF
jgi:hypothetical protein